MFEVRNVIRVIHLLMVVVVEIDRTADVELARVFLDVLMFLVRST
jgi:hypothetical protein